MDIREEYSLRTHNTLGVNATAAYYISYRSVEELGRLVRDEYFQESRYLHIGEGSNLLFLTNFRGIILRSEIKDIELQHEDDVSVRLRVGAGCIWDDFVAYAVEHGYYGVENLSLIPGQVGAAAIQNIGAYGAEAQQVVYAVEAVHRRSGEQRTFGRAECQYAYRHSIFKEPEYAEWIVTYVQIELSKEAKLNLGYADLERYFANNALEPTLARLRDAVIEIRNSKLPDYKVLGNAGSFFMNPVVSAECAEALRGEYPSMPYYPQADGRVKLAAGWLIEQCGLKGYRDGDAGVYERQALILVNHGEATGSDIARVAEHVRLEVQAKFQIELHPEVRYIS
ncbi:MAG: UDP-N-acetylmuramate dehydrogenase [Porphyromonas sp.]|nr:UDP-N-acetylmuramate dehydrogenase [Porphyromonas sp.]